jgi:hypothetical protein
MAKTFQSPATLTGIVPKADGSLSLRFVTEQELTPTEKLTALEFFNSRGWVLFRQNEFKPEDVPTKDAENDETKSPSTRLRNVLFVYWDQKKKNKTDFDTFYRQEMNKIIEVVKDKLE